MCGIIGFIGSPREGAWGQTYAILAALFADAQHRGEHATGFAAIAAPLRRPSRRMIVAKQPLPADVFMRRDPSWRRLRHQRCSALIGHVRWATHGSPMEPVNNHPFVNGRLAVVHNGVISNHREIADRDHLRLVSECDSEIILRLTERMTDPVDGLADSLRLCNGSMAVAVLDQQSGHVLLARNSGRPLWLARTRNDRRIFFASTEIILIRALRSVLGRLTQLDLLLPIATNEVLTLTDDGAIIAIASTGLRSSA